MTSETPDTPLTPSTVASPPAGVPVSDPDLEEQRRQVLARYARIRPDGRPTFCAPSRVELAGNRLQGPGTDGKVIFPDREAAEAAARELEALGSRPMRAHECKRSRHGHCHLTTDTGASR